METAKLLLILLGHIHHQLPSQLVLMLMSVLRLECCCSSHHSGAISAPFMLSQVKFEGDRMERLLASCCITVMIMMMGSPARADLFVHRVSRFLIFGVHLLLGLDRVARTVQQEFVSAL